MGMGACHPVLRRPPPLLTPRSPNGGVGVQVMGPDDGYLCQFSRSTGAFWADPNDLALGATFQAKGAASPRSLVPQVGRVGREDDTLGRSCRREGGNDETQLARAAGGRGWEEGSLAAQGAHNQPYCRERGWLRGKGSCVPFSFTMDLVSPFPPP